MKVILEKDVKSLGKKGDVVNIAEGYGRNYLLPRALAVEATEGNVKKVTTEKKTQENKRDKALKEAQEKVGRIDGQKLQISVKVGDAGKLFGSITSQEIADRLKKQYKVEIDKRKIDLSEPIKNLGKYTIVVRVHPKVQATIVVHVVGN